MANQLDNEIVSDETKQDERNTETAASSSREYDSTEVQGNAADARCTVPLCGLVYYVMGFFGLICVYTQRLSLSVAIVAMVNQTALTDDEEMSNTTNTSGTDECPRDPELNRTQGEFTWDRHEQAAALAVFSYGQLVSQVPGGWLADRYGGKWIFGGSILALSVTSLLMPAAARIHLGVFLLLRILAGFSAGFVFPAMQALNARWSTARNRSIIVGVMIFGGSVGVIVGMLLSGVLCDHGFAGGWPSVFYVFGMIGCLWSGAWCFLVYDSPSTHPRISKTELGYWERETNKIDLVARPATPWRKLLTSIPVWALALAFFASDWGTFTMASCIPLFMHDVLGFDMTKNGVLSAVPFFSIVFVIPLGWFADWLRSPGRMSTTVVRKVFCTTGFILAGCMLILTGYTGCNRDLAVALLFLATSCASISIPVVLVNQLDLAPLHAGKIMGLTNFVANVAQIVAVHVVGALTYERSTRSEWQNVFFVAAGVYALGAVVFVIFGSGDRQSWAESPDKGDCHTNGVDKEENTGECSLETTSERF